MKYYTIFSILLVCALIWDCANGDDGNAATSEKGYKAYVATEKGYKVGTFQDHSC